MTTRQAFDHMRATARLALLPLYAARAIDLLAFAAAILALDFGDDNEARSVADRMKAWLTSAPVGAPIPESLAPMTLALTAYRTALHSTPSITPTGRLAGQWID